MEAKQRQYTTISASPVDFLHDKCFLTLYNKKPENLLYVELSKYLNYTCDSVVRVIPEERV